MGTLGLFSVALDHVVCDVVGVREREAYLGGAYLRRLVRGRRITIDHRTGEYGGAQRVPGEAPMARW